MLTRLLTLVMLALLIAGTASAPLRATAADSALVWGGDLAANLDPHANLDVGAMYVLLNVYDNLYRYEGNPPKLRAWLAESYTASRDGRTWEFKLRPGVKFHDGSDLTADDVAWSFKRLLGMGKAPAGSFVAVLKADNVTAVDRATVRFVLEKPYAPFLAAVTGVAIVNRRQVEPRIKDGDWGFAWLASNDAGSGAYTIDLSNYIPQKQLDMRRNPKHFVAWTENPRPVEVVKSRAFAETSTRVLALMKGDLDTTDSYLPTDEVERLAKVKDVVVHKDQSMRIFLIRMNNMKPPFDNVHARRCFSHAFNYDAFIRVILKNLAERNPAPLPKNVWGYPEGIKGYEFDLVKARAECDKARGEGAKLDRELEIHILSTLAQTGQAAQLFQSDLRKIGINAKVVADTWANIVTNTAKPETSPDMWVHWVSSYFVDPDNWIGTMYDSQMHGTWKASAFYKKPKVDELLRTARATMNQAERARMYAEAARIVVDDAADIWIYNTVEIRGVRARVKNFKFCPVGSGNEVRFISLGG
jgi:peptide/nickel transport system substrate-binding protein